jgi:D-beta-D-heptose 7-phosphate kinase/D-beta-D-heptose 1-phosphate adenosyltransferase
MDLDVDWNAFHHRRILVVGDLMLDRYLWGDVQRISPEAPVPVFQVRNRSEAEGGAGNVVANLVGLGVWVTVIGVRGDDESGRLLRARMKHPRIRDLSLECPGRPTVTKTRLVANGQQLIRMDEEQIQPVGPEILHEALRQVAEQAEEADGMVLSDYDKGMLHAHGLCRSAVQIAQRRGIPILVDPKGRDWERFRGATCITPNLREIEAFEGSPIETTGQLESAMRRTIRKLDLDWLLVTRGSAGMCLMSRDGVARMISTEARQIYDVSGAGDTVIATLALAVATGIDFPDAARLANLAAGIVVGKVGTQPVHRFELQDAWRAHGAGLNGYAHRKVSAPDAALTQADAWRANRETIVFTNGCFDLLHPGHIHLLHQAKDLGQRLVVGLNTDASVQRLKGPARPFLNERDRAAILASLDAVDLVVPFDEDTPEQLIALLKPDVLVKGSDYRLEQVIGREMVESYGGKVQLVEVLEGYSTTRIAQRVQQSGQPAPCPRPE